MNIAETKAQSKFRLPSNRQRLAIMGRTGSGKTQFAGWVLSEAPFDRQPYVIIDYKYDDLLNGSDRIREIGLDEIPKYPGLYILHPRPSVDDGAVEAWFWKVLDREKIGLYIDEAYMVPDKAALQAVLTQGRSKNIPVIALTQRPTWISRFIFSEADYYSVFHLQDARDRQTVQSFLPAGLLDERQPPFHSRWHDVGHDLTFDLLPVPNAETILDRIDTRLSPKRHRI